VRNIFAHASARAAQKGLKLLQMGCPGCPFGKLLIITPRASGKAHERNLVRRRLKALFYTHELFKYPLISVILTNKNTHTLTPEILKNFLIKNINS
jgi:ribonuclease P protein component